MIRHLILSSKFLKALLSGAKKTTVRPGVLKVAGRVYIHSRGQIEAVAEVSRVVYKKLRDLTDLDAELDGFKSREEMVAYLKKRYPGLRDCSVLTVIYFNNVEKASLPEDVHYGGMTPVEIATAALQRVRLSEEEILKAVVETGSLRKAAVKLFGTIEKRSIIRKTLRKALARLRGGELEDKKEG